MKNVFLINAILLRSNWRIPTSSISGVGWQIFRWESGQYHANKNFSRNIDWFDRINFKEKIDILSEMTFAFARLLKLKTGIRGVPQGKKLGPIFFIIFMKDWIF